ncbi:Pentatricopeptide repeat [Dillenia turbinata]|uniref:Pentatricopeptide repeat n=1 Tax=Dillenia turbinata TaxID=194707 RepID=A0AAN8ZJ30_9MAGN
MERWGSVVHGIAGIGEQLSQESFGLMWLAVSSTDFRSDELCDYSSRKIDMMQREGSLFVFLLAKLQILRSFSKRSKSGMGLVSRSQGGPVDRTEGKVGVRLVKARKFSEVETILSLILIGENYRSGNMESALSLFDEMTKRELNPSADAYWALINGFFKIGQMGKAERFANEMQGNGLELDKVAYHK